MTAEALGQCPSEWIVNSNALGVAFLSREQGFRVSFLSRHAVRRLADGTLLGKTADQLLDAASTELADVPALRMDMLSDPANYPAAASTVVGDRHLELAISSVTSGDDQYLGVMVTFRDVTDQVRLRDEAAQFRSAMAEHADRGRLEADRAEQVASGVGTMAAALQDNGEAMTELVGKLGGLNGQTRMLSLNASIEATRAGESGQAFRVIADEVGQLSQQIATVTGQVNDILTSIKADSTAAQESSDRIVESVAALIAIQRAMDDEASRRA